MSQPQAPPPIAGVPIDANSIHATLGAGAKGLRDSIAMLKREQVRLAGYDGQQLATAFGMDLATCNVIKSALGEIDPFVELYAALDWLDQCAGL